MHLFVRRFYVLSSLALLAACSSAGQGVAPSAASSTDQSTPDAAIKQALDAAPETSGGRAIVHRFAMRPNAGSPAILINFLSDGPAQGGVPCISCVSGAQTNDNVGLTGPSSYIPSRATWQYSISYTDISYKGKCKLAWAITSGNKTIDSFSATINLPSEGGFVLYALNRPRPKYSGPATLTGKVTCGKENPSLHVPLEFQ